MDTRNRIRDWKGLLANEAKETKALVFVVLLVVSASMTFTQLGFIGVGANGDYLGYVLGLLAPVTASALLLGKGTGALQGSLSGAVLYAHARVQPLDLFERYFVSLLNSVVLYAVMGFLTGLLFAVALRNGPTRRRRKAYLALVCLVVSVLSVLAFLTNSILNLVISILPSAERIMQTNTVTAEWQGAIGIIGGIVAMTPLDLLLMLAVCITCDRIVRKRAQNAGHTGIRTTFRTQLFVVVALVFCVVQAASFVVITKGAEQTAAAHITDELDYLSEQVRQREAHRTAIAQAAQEYGLSAEAADALAASNSLEGILSGYDLSDGTIVVFRDDAVAYSYNPAYPVGTSADDLFDVWRSGTLQELAESTRLQEMVYDTNDPTDSESHEFSFAQLGYMRVVQVDEYYLMMAMPSSAVFANRATTMGWASMLALALLATVYALATRLLGRDVVGPIDRTNASLAKITSGNLNEVVSETDNVEFASLSEGINNTVGSLKGLIAEAERRNEQDLATAKRIQESALPRVFPPFPEVGAFDIFAAMDAAKEVGGDFFDFFLIDDQTLGFLVADVSGKGIPGALFMMAAKTELENYLSTGMGPAEAMTSANRRLCANNDAGMFVTVWAATLNWQTGLLTYVNAGHNFPLLRQGNDGSWEWLREKCGLFLGTFETAKYRQRTLVLKPGDELLLYTDGVNEAFNPAEEEYGNDRLEAFAATHANMHPRELVRSLRADVASWADGAEQSDDVTILALEYGVSPEVTGSLTVPATLDHLADVTKLVNDELDRRLCPASVRRKVDVALEELFVNVCRYAYANLEAPGDVTVSYAYGTDPSSITVELRDHGVPFDPVRREDPTRPSSIQEAKVGGLGILMVKRSMDDLAYLRDDDANVVVFRKGW